MKRRTFLALGAAAVIGLDHPSEVLGFSRRRGLPIESGWIYDPETIRVWQRRLRRPFFRRAAPHLLTGEIKTRAFLWPYLERAMGQTYKPHDQAIGDCVGQAWGLGADILTAVQAMRGRGRFIAKSSTEVIYAGSRVEIGGGRYNRAGSHGVWAAKWCSGYGIVLRRKYGEFDLRYYSGDKARRWGHVCDRCTSWGGGVPDALEAVAKQHPIRTTSLVTNWEEAVAAVANGYPVTVCSNQGFDDERGRDSQGFLRPSRWPWYHAMLLAGVDTISSRPGGLLLNSWGDDWTQGPTRLNQPPSSFWVDAAILDGMFKMGDSHALSNYVGYPQQHLDYRLY